MTVAELLATSPSGAPDRRQAFEAAARTAVEQAFVKPELLPPGVTLNPRQQELFDAVLYGDATNILYGGQVGGGKSRGFRLLTTYLARLRPNTNILFLRRTLEQLRKNHMRPWLREMPQGWATWKASEKVWEYPNGSLVAMGSCQYEADVQDLLGAEWDYVVIDELTTFTEFIVDMVCTRLRTTGEHAPKLIAGTNPGGVGHAWVKARWVDRTATENSEGEPISLDSYQFIKASLADNPAVNAEEYIKRLGPLPASLRKAYLEGDWDIYAGQFFPAFRRATHVIPAGSIDIPRAWPRFMAMDYGGTAKNATLWAAYDKANDRIYVYRERVRAGASVETNAKEILAACNGDALRSRRADPSIWNKTQADRTSLFDQFVAAGLTWQKATNDRAAGWALITRYLEVGGRPDGRPGLLILDCCPDLITALPSLVYDERRPEDIKEGSAVNDHSPDALRYLVASIVGLGGDAKPQAGGDVGQMRQQSALGRVF